MRAERLASPDGDGGLVDTRRRARRVLVGRSVVGTCCRIR